MTEQDLLAHQIAGRIAGGQCGVVSYRDPSNGQVSYGVSYDGAANKWLGTRRYDCLDLAQAGAETLSDFLACGVRR